MLRLEVKHRNLEYNTHTHGIITSESISLISSEHEGRVVLLNDTKLRYSM